MWFGNLVTMKWWDEFWLQESFTDFISYYALSNLDLSFKISDPRILQNHNKELGYSEDQMIFSHALLHPGTFYNQSKIPNKRNLFLMGLPMKKDLQYSDN